MKTGMPQTKTMDIVYVDQPGACLDVLLYVTACEVRKELREDGMLDLAELNVLRELNEYIRYRDNKKCHAESSV